MAKARIVADDTDDSLTEQAEELAKLNEEEGGEVFRAIEELRGTDGVQLMVVRITPQETSGYVGMMPVAEFSHERMQKLYGGGLYKVRVKGPKGFLPGGGPVKIADVPESKKTAGWDNFGHFLEAQERREEERRKEESERRSKIWELAMVSVPTLLAGFFNRTPPQSDIPALIAALKPAPGPTITDLTSALANMQTLTNPKNSESQVDTILKVFGAAQDLMSGKEGDGKTGEGSNWVDVIRDLIKVAPDAIKPMLEARMAAMQNPAATVTSVAQVPVGAIASAPISASPGVQHANINSVGVVEDPSGVPGSDEEMLKLFMPLIKANLSKVAGWAEKDRDPEVYADVLVDELPDNFGSFIPLNKIFEYLNHPQWFEEVVKIEPRLQSHKEWCDECRMAIIEIMKVFQSEAVQPAATDETASPTE